jgi:choline dehydrogenase-like flavoprotein
LKEIGCGCHIVPQANYFAPKSGYFATKMPMHSLGHQVGTCKFGEDSTTSVLDLNCRAHDVDNLYVADGSFFVSSGAVNPTLTIIANALRVGDHILDRLGMSRCEDTDVPVPYNPSFQLTSTQAQSETVLAK